ncbi:RICIN domain-containing protein [Sorangium sp. So ce693]|uniref:RICIN domain-containing protein n=1 Tax=Sorangium sp. So ce693 TaxID=3133318 RepID=UPI003F633243
MTTTTKTEKPLGHSAAERVKKLRDHLSGGATANSRSVGRLQKNRAANPLLGVALHAAARLEAGHELSDLEQDLVDALECGISRQEVKAWGKAYQETQSSRRREFLPDTIAELSLDTAYTLQNLADSLPALTREVAAQPNVRIVDVAKLAPDQGIDLTDEAFVAAQNEYGISVTCFMNSAAKAKPAPDPAPAEAGSGEVLSSSEAFIIQPFKMQTIKRSGDTVFGPSDEIFWAMGAGSDTGEKWEFRSREFGSCDDGDWDWFALGDLAFCGRVDGRLTMTIECWEKDAGAIFDGISNALFKVADACVKASNELAGDPDTDAAGWAALIAIVSALVAELLKLFNNEDDHVATRTLGWTRAALLSLNNTEQRFRFDGETDRGMGIQDLYLRFATIPLGTPMRIVAQHSNMDITIDAGNTWGGAEVHQWVWSNQPHQQFILNYTGQGHFRFVAAHCLPRAMVLDVTAASQSNGVELVLWEWGWHYRQQFRLDPLGNHWFRIVARHSRKVLDVRGGSTANKGVIQQYQWTNVPQQKWKIWPAG